MASSFPTPGLDAAGLKQELQRTFDRISIRYPFLEASPLGVFIEAQRFKQRIAPGALLSFALVVGLRGGGRSKIVSQLCSKHFSGNISRLVPSTRRRLPSGPTALAFGKGRPSSLTSPLVVGSMAFALVAGPLLGRRLFTCCSSASCALVGLADPPSSVSSAALSALTPLSLSILLSCPSLASAACAVHAKASVKLVPTPAKVHRQELSALLARTSATLLAAKGGAHELAGALRAKVYGGGGESG